MNVYHTSEEKGESKRESRIVSESERERHESKIWEFDEKETVG